MHRRTLLHALGLAPLLTAGRAAGLDLWPVPGGQAPALPDVELTLTAAPASIPLLPGEATRVWRFTGEIVKGPASSLQVLDESYLGPVIRLVRGQRVRIRFRNRLAEPSIVHWHGLDVPAAADGHPRLAVDGGADYVYDFTVTNRAGTYWYHPHPHMRTGPQVYQGLAGMLIVSDPEEQALGLPSGDGELVCVLQDRRFDANNQLMYPNPPAATTPAGGMGMGRGRGGRGRGRGMGGMGMGMPMGQMMELMNGWVGSRMLVNGRVEPTRDVGRRTYRVRLLNGSNARFYKLAWSDGTAMTVVGSDGGLLEHPRALAALTLAPGQRADVLLDLSGHEPGDNVQLRTLAFSDDDIGRVGMMGETSPVPQGAPLTLMTLRVTDARGPRVAAPERLSTHTYRVVPNAPVRRVPITFMQMQWLIDGRTFDLTDVAGAESVAPGSTHIWEFVNQPNPMGMMAAHPIHLHGPQFRVLSRAGGTANALREGIHDQGWTDTVVVLPGETVRVQVTFSTHPGLYLYHCHILEHEDMGMMRNFRIRG
ncbi:MAG TPA: multicopper oxidase domain-containing protein [Vicinamibacterales bacterium]|nr:multicopper oxidase domain-containing protein [Vicinamibacterales bacterium]